MHKLKHKTTDHQLQPLPNQCPINSQITISRIAESQTIQQINSVQNSHPRNHNRKLKSHLGLQFGVQVWKWLLETIGDWGV